MFISGCLALAWLEEDDPVRSFFRVKPVAILDAAPPLALDSVAELGGEGCLRVVPDKNEIGTFKTRMRTLGGICLLDLRAHPRDNDKIRPNKNYALGNDSNSQMIYSDVISAVPSQTVYEVLSRDSARMSLTSRVFIRTDDGIEGPYMSTDSGGLGDAGQTPARYALAEVAQNILELKAFDGSAIEIYVNMRLTGRAEKLAEDHSGATDAHTVATTDKAVVPTAVVVPSDAPQTIPAAAYEEQYARAIARSGAATQQAAQAVSAATALLQSMVSVQRQLNPVVAPVSRLYSDASAPQPYCGDARALQDPNKHDAFWGPAMRSGAYRSDQIRAYDVAKDELWRLQKLESIARPVATAPVLPYAANVNAQGKANVQPATGTASAQAVSATVGTTPATGVTNAQAEPTVVGANPATGEVDSQTGATDVNGDASIVAQANADSSASDAISSDGSTCPAATPVDMAMDAVTAAWEYPGARPALAERLTGLDGFCDSIYAASPEAAAAHSNATLLALEEERLQKLVELGRLERREKDARERAFNEMIASNEKDVGDLLDRKRGLERELEGARNELAQTRAECDACVAETARELDRPLTERIASQLAGSKLAGLMPREGIRSIRVRGEIADCDSDGIAEPYSTSERAGASKETVATPETLSAEQLIDRLSSGLYNAGWLFARDDIVNICVCIALGEPIMLAGFPGNDDARLYKLLARILGATERCEHGVKLRWQGRLNAPERGAHVRHNGVGMSRGARPAVLSGLLDYPQGLPVTPQLADSGFIIRRCGEPRPIFNEPIEYAPVDAESFRGLLSAGGIADETMEAFARLRQATSEQGGHISSGAMNACLRYCAAAGRLMSGGETQALDYALSERVLPSLLASGILPLMRALPDIYKGMSMCGDLLCAPMPVQFR